MHDSNIRIGGRNNVQLRNHAAVDMAKEIEERGNLLYQEEDTVVGYIYRADGRYTKHYLEPSLDNIARFICSNDQDKLLCNSLDYAIASTMGTYLDLAIKSFIDKILPHLEKYQHKGEYTDYESIE